MIAHVQLAGFFVAAERAARPDLDGRPLIIGGGPGARGFVAAASPEARERGVTAGMRLSHAAALAPDAVCLPGSIERYLEIAAQIDERLRRCAAAVEWAAIDEAWLRLEDGATGAGHALDAARAGLAREFGIHAAIGAGTSKAVASIASRLMAPAGMLIVLPGYEARLLAPLDVARLPGLDEPAVTALRAEGVATIGDLAALDPQRLLACAGPAGAVLARHARGLDDRPIHAAESPKGIARSAVYGACGGTQARGAIARLAEQAAAALRRSGHGAGQIRLRVRDQAGERMRVHLLPAPASTSHEILERADALALRLLHPGRDLHEAAIVLTALTPVDPQLQLNWRTA